MSSNNLITENSGTGAIYLGDSSYNTISNNTGLNITLFGSNNNNITNNTINGSYELAIGMDNSSNNNIFNNTLSNTDRGISIENSSNNNNITGNTITNVFGDGINVANSSENTIADNQFTNAGTAYGSVAAITLWQSNNNQIRNNTIVEGGINLWGSTEPPTTGNIIEDNEISGHLNGPGETQGNGILLNGASANIINRNKIHDNEGQGIVIENHSDENQITGNNIYNNNFGISISVSILNIIANNTINNNTFKGISIHHNATNNTVSDNNITNNGEFGIVLNTAADNNLITRNEIIANGFNETWGGGINFEYVEEITSTGNEISWNNISWNNNDGVSLTQESQATT
jgi:parallel beta-helix repeat protein